LKREVFEQRKEKHNSSGPMHTHGQNEQGTRRTGFCQQAQALPCEQQRLHLPVLLVVSCFLFAVIAVSVVVFSVFVVVVAVFVVFVVGVAAAAKMR
jgi:uncharacterized membrane protein